MRNFTYDVENLFLAHEPNPPQCILYSSVLYHRCRRKAEATTNENPKQMGKNLQTIVPSTKNFVCLCTVLTTHKFSLAFINLVAGPSVGPPSSYQHLEFLSSSPFPPIFPIHYLNIRLFRKTNIVRASYTYMCSCPTLSVHRPVFQGYTITVILYESTDPCNIFP